MEKETINMEEVVTTQETTSTQQVMNTKESISINNSKELYQIESIEQTLPNILKIVFTDTIPNQFGDIEVYTPGGTPEDCNLIGYDTMYLADGQTIYLSNDGSVYVAPELPEDTETVLLPEHSSDSK